MLENLKAICSHVIIKVETFQEQTLEFHSLGNIVTVMKWMCTSVKKKSNEKYKKEKLDSAMYFLLFCNLYVMKHNFIQISEGSVIFDLPVEA